MTVTDPTAYALDVARLLWPGATSEPSVSRQRRRADGARRDAYVFPSARRPRVLMPADVPGSASMLERLGKGRTGLARTTRDAFVRSVGSRAFGYLRWPVLSVRIPAGSDDSVEHYLSAQLGAEVRVGVLLGTPRANQKPVLQIFRPDGALLGFAKVGHNPLTARLVRREAESLAVVGRHRARSFRAPLLLHRGSWRGLDVIVLAPLVTRSNGPLTAGTLAAAMREVAAVGGARRGSLTDGPFWARLQAQCDAVADRALRGQVELALSRAEGRWAGTVLDFGGWHGDWGHWNMAVVDGVVHLWDWERYDGCVPLGFDALHHAAARVRPLDRDLARQERLFVDAAPTTLAAMGVRPQHVEPTLEAYLLEVAVRYAVALDEVSAPRLRRRAEWALVLLDRLEEARR